MDKPLGFTCLLLFFVLILANFSYAQNNQNSIAITFLGGVSVSAPQNNLKGNFYGAQIGYQLDMSRNDVSWVHLLHVKDVGFAFSYFNFQNVSLMTRPGSQGIFGNNYGIINYLDMSFFKVGKTEIIFSPGIGFVYATQTFYTSVQNPTVGSHINLAVQAGVKLRIPISSVTQIQAGMNIFHYSNSAAKLPNDGINNINVSFGIVQDINSTGPRRYAATFGIDNKNSFEIGIGMGRRGFVQIYQYTDKQTGKVFKLTDTADQKNAVSNLYQAGLYASYNYRISSLFSLKAGTDIVYYLKPFSYDNFFKTIQDSGTSFDNLTAGISIGSDLWMGRMAFTTNFGYYLHYASPYPTHFYWTIGGKYYLNNWIALNAKIYLHGFEAQYSNFGVLFTVL